jgi:probable HAF family extracellular repeat protein
MDDRMEGLGDLPGGGFFSIARAISADGGVIVGQGTSTSGQEAFRWTEDDGMVGLARLSDLRTPF